MGREDRLRRRVQLDVRNPIDGIALRDLALEMGLEDVFDEGFSDFPDVSSYLYNERVRRKLEELGYDSYRGEDGYLWVTVVWDPDRIRVLSHCPYGVSNTGKTYQVPDPLGG